jgi:hypothetical protein
MAVSLRVYLLGGVLFVLLFGCFVSAPKYQNDNLFIFLTATTQQNAKTPKRDGRNQST